MTNISHSNRATTTIKNVIDNKTIYTKEALLKAMDVKIGRFQDAIEELRDDEEIALKALEMPNNFCFLSDRLKDNEKLATIAVSQSGYLIEFVSDRLKDNLDLVKLAAIRIDSPTKAPARLSTLNVRHASLNIRNDIAFAHTLISINPDCINHLGEEVKNDKAIATKLLSINPNYITYLGEEIKNDKELAKLVLEKDSSVIKQFNTSVFDDVDILMTTLRLGDSYFGLESKETKEIIRNDIDKGIEIFEILKNRTFIYEGDRQCSTNNKTTHKVFFSKYVSKKFKTNYIEGMDCLNYLMATKLENELNKDDISKVERKGIKI